MKLPPFIKSNLLLKITSLNSVTVAVRLVVTVFVQRFISGLLGPSGYAKVGDLRNLISMLESFATVGIFNGIVKYVSEHKKDQEELNKLFSTSFTYMIVACITVFLVFFFGADYLSDKLFRTGDQFSFVFKLLAVIVPFIALNRFFNGIINGLSAYKKYTAITIIGYLLSAGLLVFCAYKNNLEGALFAIAITPVIQFTILFILFAKTVKEYIQFENIRFAIPYRNQLFAFTLMSFVSTLLSNFVEIDIRNTIEKSINESDAGYWTAITVISKNYLLFASSLFTLYVIPKFAAIKTNIEFRKEVFSIYKTLLPLFGLGMVLVYVLRYVIIDIVFPTFAPMESLFKWQLMGDFVKLMAVIVAHQFLAKRMVTYFILTEIISLFLFYALSNYFITDYGAEGVVLAHFLRYVIYFIVVVFLLKDHFFGKEKTI